MFLACSGREDGDSERDFSEECTSKGFSSEK
jgi:hypothetical protein